MELFALISLNIAFGMGLYIFFSAKMNRLLKETQGSQAEKKIRVAYSEFIHESNQSMQLLTAKNQGMRELIQRAERIHSLLKESSDAGTGVSIQLQNLINLSKDILEEGSHNIESISHKSGLADLKELVSDGEIPQSNRLQQTGERNPDRFSNDEGMSTYGNPPTLAKHEERKPNHSRKIYSYVENNVGSEWEQKKITPTPKEFQKLSSVEPIRDSAPNLLSGIGKKVRSFMGMDNPPVSDRIKQEQFQNSPSPNRTTIPKKSIMIDGDVFDQTDEIEKGIRDLEAEKIREENSFLSTLKEMDSIPKRKDEITITPESVLAELQPSATKIDKVVHLLKRGYSYEEVSDALDIGTREVKLIETVRLERTRRF